MATRADVTPNRRGMRSRELVLDAAERVMAEQGFEAATLARVVEEAGIPMSSVYHYYGSKDGILLAVMERGAERFFADLPELEPADRTSSRAPEPQCSRPRPQTLERHPNFLRLLIVFAVQPPAADGNEIEVVVARVRAPRTATACASRSRSHSATTPTAPSRIRLARIALATIDGAFVASQADGAVTLEDLLEPLGPAVVAVRRALLAKAR